MLLCSQIKLINRQNKVSRTKIMLVQFCSNSILISTKLTYSKDRKMIKINACSYPRWTHPLLQKKRGRFALFYFLKVSACSAVCPRKASRAWRCGFWLKWLEVKSPMCAGPLNTPQRETCAEVFWILKCEPQPTSCLHSGPLHMELKLSVSSILIYSDKNLPI